MVAALGGAPAALTWQAGVDALSFGGTKNGMAFGEAVVFFNKELVRNFEYRAETVRAVGIEDAVLVGPVDRDAGRRRLAPACIARERDG